MPIDRPGYEQVTLSLPVDKTALVGMHCWNIGCSDGPPVDVNYCVGMGWPQSTEEAGRIMAEVIRPAMDAARAIGMTVCHVETDWMDHQYPHIESRRSGESGSVHPHQQEMLERAHGVGYMEHSPRSAQMRRAEIVSPVGDEPLFFTPTCWTITCAVAAWIHSSTWGSQPTCACSVPKEERGPCWRAAIAAWLSAMRPLGWRRQRRFPQRLSTNYALHIFEWTLGFGCTFAQFQQAIDQMKGEQP